MKVEKICGNCSYGFKEGEGKIFCSRRGLVFPMDWDCIHFSPIRERQYRIEKEGDKVTVWDDARGVGLRFIEGDTLQRYTSELILKDTEEWEEVDADTLTAISNTLTDYAAERYPKEFEPIKTE